MADKISIEQVNELQAILRTDASLDAKVQSVTAAKSSIKQHNVPDNAIPSLFDALRAASTSQHAVLVNAGFTGLNHLLTRLSRQEPKFLVKEAARTLPLITEKLGDQKEKFRSIALQSLTTLYRAAPMDVERSVRNTAMAGKNPRAKEASMQWLLQMHQEQGLQFRAYVPVLMDLLEDADGMVRDAAKATVIELFRNAPNAAKADLKKQLKNFKVRPAIEQAIVKALAPTSSASAESLEPPRPESARAVRPATAANLGASVSSLSGSRPVTPVPDSAGRPDQVEPTYVNTHRELDEMIKDMHIWFEGRESEQNWMKREESVNKLRRLIAGNASDFQESFLNGVRGLLDGVIKAMISLRTSLCKEGCSFIQDLANTYGPGIDPMVELLMQTLVKLSAGTKKISSQLANATIDAILSRATFNTRLLQHIWGACQDKNIQPRTYATGWLKTVLSKEAHHKERIEHGGGLDIVEKCIKKGLNDPNPGVRERMRATYWLYSSLWPSRAETIMSNLDATAQRLLQNDSNNPNSPKRSESRGATRPALGLSKSTMGSSKPSLRETMMAKRKEAMAARNMPARPGSAMAHFSPTRNVSNSSATSSAAAAAATGTGRPRAEGGLSVAPVRPAKRRPELHARPATAGPYSVRTHDHPSVEQASPPERVRPKAAITPKSLAATPKRTGARPRPGHQTTASESSLPTPSRGAAAAPTKAKAAQSARQAAMSSPRGSPPKPKLASRSAAAAAAAHGASPSRSSPSRLRDRDEAQRPGAPMAVSPPKFVPAVLEDVPAAMFDDVVERDVSSPPLKVYEDPFQDEQSTPKPTVPLFATTVLEDKPINETSLSPLPVVENASATSTTSTDSPQVDPATAGVFPMSPEKTRQNMRLLDSGIARVKAQTLDVHGFRKLQGIIRDAGSVAGGGGGGEGGLDSQKTSLLTDERFDALLTGLFTYLEAPLMSLAPEKAQDVKAQILATIKLLLKKARDNFQPHVSRGLEALLAARAGYDARTHIVAGLELLADELVALGDASEIVVVLTRSLTAAGNGSVSGSVSGNSSSSLAESTTATTTSPTAWTTSEHALSMGLHVLKVLVDARPAFQPSDTELAALAGLAQGCLESSASGVRMDAVQLCVAVHERVGDGRFWAALHGVRDDPKSLITYYIVKRQREAERA